MSALVERLEAEAVKEMDCGFDTVHSLLLREAAAALRATGEGECQPDPVVVWEGKSRKVSEHLFLLTGARDGARSLVEHLEDVTGRQQRAIDELRAAAPTPAEPLRDDVIEPGSDRDWCRSDDEPPGSLNSPEGLTSKQAWWAGARAGLRLPADTSRAEVAARLAQAREPLRDAGVVDWRARYRTLYAVRLMERSNSLTNEGAYRAANEVMEEIEAGARPAPAQVDELIAEYREYFDTVRLPHQVQEFWDKLTAAANEKNEPAAYRTLP